MCDTSCAPAGLPSSTLSSSLNSPSAPATDNDDTLDVFEDALSSIFEEHMPAKGDPGCTFTYTPPFSTGLPPLSCRIPPQRVNSLFAHHVWSSGLRIADTLAERSLIVEGEDVVELGAGAGIVGLMAARMGAKRVVLTDYDDPALVANLRSNISSAFPDSPDRREGLYALGHTWGEETSLQAVLAANDFSPFTHILLADTIWLSAGHSALLSSLVRLLARTPRARIHICSGFHSGRATVRSFLRKARKEGLVRRGKWEEVGVKGERRDWGWDGTVQRSGREEGDVGRRAEEEEVEEDEWEEKEDLSERNKWVVEGDLGWCDEVLDDVRGSSGAFQQLRS
ncbi:hypothetical protein JCM11251_003010 [Rhodosporidiobolus azoricus]